MFPPCKLLFPKSSLEERLVSNAFFTYFASLDIYITMVSNAHAVCAKDLYIAIVSATVETDAPQKEIEPALALLGPVKEMFTQISDLHEPTNDWAAENLHITKSYDATSHFETSDEEVLAIYERIVGEKFDLNIQPTDDEDDM
jgi:Rab GDP dissociation inhibitor